MADRLCLACSSSLPPRSTNAAFTPPNSSIGSPSRRVNEGLSGVFTTRCCNRPICPTCLHTNPRLARYNPCLHCLGGVDVLNGDRASSRPTFQSRVTQQDNMNLDGGLSHEDLFTLGDDEDGDDETEDESSQTLYTAHDTLDRATSCLPPDVPCLPSTEPVHDAAEGTLQSGSSETHSLPAQYHIQPGDTLLGIALRCKVDGHVLCRLNGLPPSTLRTTPHLLHTRTVLTLPPSAKLIADFARDDKVRSENDPGYEARRSRERAAKRLQTVTKEVDWRVAKSYVALAEISSDNDDYSKEADDKKRRPGGDSGGSSLEATAVDRYLDDDEWEQRERREGRTVQIPRFPLFEANVISAGQRPTLGKFWLGWKRS